MKSPLNNGIGSAGWPESYEQVTRKENSFFLVWDAETTAIS
jgi:hypothetical protein